MFVLFWNVNQRKHGIAKPQPKKPLVPETLRCLRDFLCPDIIVLAEHDLWSETEWLAQLNDPINQDYYPIKLATENAKKWLAVFTKLPPIELMVEPLPNQFERFQLLKYKPINSLGLPDKALYIGLIHLQSKIQGEDIAYYHARKIGAILQSLKGNQMIIGDFNADPFEDFMVSRDSFFAISEKNYLSKIRRTGFDETTIKGKKEKKFWRPLYAPFWHHYPKPGVSSRHPNILINEAPGTYFYNFQGLRPRIWHRFDQPLVSDKIAQHLVQDDYGVISGINGFASLITKELRPNKKLFSDHLPIFIKLPV